MTGATVQHFLLTLTGRLTRFDQKMMERGRGHNPYALSHYLEAVEKIESKLTPYLHRDDPEAMEALREALFKGFVHSGGKFFLPPVNQVVKMIDLWLAKGKFPKYGTSLRSQVIKLAHRNPALRPYLLPLLTSR